MKHYCGGEMVHRIELVQTARPEWWDWTPAYHCLNCGSSSVAARDLERIEAGIGTVLVSVLGF